MHIRSHSRPSSCVGTNCHKWKCLIDNVCVLACSRIVLVLPQFAALICMTTKVDRSVYKGTNTKSDKWNPHRHKVTMMHSNIGTQITLTTPSRECERITSWLRTLVCSSTVSVSMVKRERQQHNHTTHTIHKPGKTAKRAPDCLLCLRIGFLVSSDITVVYPKLRKNKSNQVLCTLEIHR